MTTNQNDGMQIFENSEFGQITTIEKDGEPWFVAKDLANILEYSQTQAMTKLLDSNEKRNQTFWMTPTNVTQKTIINESGLYTAIFGSNMLKAKTFKKWVTSEVLPSIRKTGSYTAPTISESENYSTAKARLDLELFAQTQLKASDASKLMITHEIFKDYGVPTKYLPVYTRDIKATFSAKDLLSKNECGISSVAFNKLMLASGFLEEKTRSSSKHPDKIKKFKALTDSGLKYGQNDASKQNPRETQPHYFEDSFKELFALINL